MSYIIKGIKSPQKIPIDYPIRQNSVYVKIVTANDWTPVNSNYSITIPATEHNCGSPCWILGVEEKINGVFNSILYNSSINEDGDVTIISPVNTTVRISIIGWTISINQSTTN